MKSDAYFSRSGVAISIREELGPDAAGAFFVFTSNVDAHSADTFHACEVRECHGNTELWQCSEPCCDETWRAPENVHFEIDPETLLAPSTRSGGFAEVPTESALDCTEAPRLGRVRYQPRPNLLRYWPAETARPAGFDDNWPRCPHCGELARPAVLMFEDTTWRGYHGYQARQAERYKAWRDAMQRVVRARSALGERVGVVVLELGAGARVTTVRDTSHLLLQLALRIGADGTLVRVNPEFPLSDTTTHDGCTVPVMTSTLTALRAIDAELSESGP